MSTKKRMLLIWPSMIIAIIFGIMTIKSGAAVLFFDGEARLAEGNYYGVVLCFNFLIVFIFFFSLNKSINATTIINPTNT